MLNASHAAQIFVTMGLSIVLLNLALMAFGTDYRTVRTPYEGSVIYLGTWAIGLPRIVAFGAALLMMVGLLLFLSRTLLGKAITAVSQDRMAAQLMGIDIYRMYTIAFAIGVMFVGVAGSLLTPMYATFPSVGQYFGLTSYVVVVLGGMGNVVGALFGGLLIGVVEALSGYFIAPALKEAIYFVIFVVVLFIKPSGLFGIVGAEEMGIK
jgi:branched-chain amino acid transport system permease protein